MHLPRKFQRVHMIGIGGSGMSGIAEILHNLGFQVTGSDLSPSAITRRLESLGIPVSYGHDPQHLGDAQVVVYSTAIPPDNPELVEARRRKLAVIHRAEMLAELMRMKYSIAVSGSHGKTTTTSMIAHVLSHAGLKPTVFVGGILRDSGTGGQAGQGPYMVAEADESDASFLKLYPTIAVVTNVDREHLNHYGNFIRLKQAFLEFVDKVPFYGLALLNRDDPHAAEVAEAASRRVMTYGFHPEADLVAENPWSEGFEGRAQVRYHQQVLGTLHLPVPGLHNLQNALAAIAVALELEIPADTALEALAGFQGVMRRFEIKGTRAGITVVDDYGHHPTEIRRVLETARRYWKKGRIVVVFQPHRYSRTALLYRHFGPALRLADLVLLTPIYAAGEAPLPGITSALLLEGFPPQERERVRLVDSLDDALKALQQLVQPGDLVITLGAGNVYTVGEKLLEELAQWKGNA